MKSTNKSILKTLGATVVGRFDLHLPISVDLLLRFLLTSITASDFCCYSVLILVITLI